MRDTLIPLLSDGERGKARHARRSLLVGVFVALVVLALVVPPMAVRSSVADDGPEVVPGRDSDVFPLVGELTFHDETGSVVPRPVLVGIDPGLHLAIFWEANKARLRLVDTRTLEHLDVIELPEEFTSEIKILRAVVDDEHHRVFLPTAAVGPSVGEEIHECGTPGIVFGTICTEHIGAQLQPAILTVSLTGEHPPIGRSLSMEMAPEESQLLTEIATKLAYHSPTDRVYAVTESSHGFSDATTSKVDSYTALHEFDADDLVRQASEEPAEAIWSYRLQTCDQAVRKYGGFLARSVHSGFLYLPCEGLTVGKSSLKMHGAVRIELVSGTDSSDTSQFEEHFHPFAADLSSGGATGDAANDLILFVGSAAEANRLFTFDAYHEAWTGATALPEAGDVISPTTNPQTGRIYAMTNGGNEDLVEIRVTEGDRVAVPNGTDYDVGVISATGATPKFDPSTRRLFVGPAGMCHEWTEEWQRGEWQPESGSRCVTPEDEDAMPHFRVFEDRTPEVPAPEQEDYDQYTEDVSEADGPVFTSAGANARAFGARYLFAGGLAGSRAMNPGRAQQLRSASRSAPLGPSTRDILRAQVREASLSRVTGTPSVVASAAGLTLGDQTRSDLKRNTDHGWPEDFPEEMRGSVAYCDDFGGEPTEDAKPGAAVSCDSLDAVGRAGALYTGTDEQAPIQVGYAETSIDVREDEALGAVVTTTAVARDIDLFGQVSIGEIRTEATAIAHGRPGTAATELVREYRQVRVGDSFACGWGPEDPCDAWEIVRAINNVMQPRLMASVPAQDTTLNPDASDEPDDEPGKARVSNATPGGARAIVTLDPYDAQSNLTINQDQRTELPGLQIVYYDDHNEVSRHIFQFAAVNLDVFYYVSSAPTFDPPDWTDGGGDDDLDTGGPGDGLLDGPAGAARTVKPPPIVALGEEPVARTEEPESDAGEPAPATGDAHGSEFETDTGTAVPQQGQAPGLGTGDGPTVSTGEDVPAPEIAPDESAGEQAVVAQGEQGGASGPGGLMLTRQRMGETVPLAVLWMLATLPFYLAVRRRRLLASSTR